MWIFSVEYNHLCFDIAFIIAVFIWNKFFCDVYNVNFCACEETGVKGTGGKFTNSKNQRFFIINDGCYDNTVQNEFSVKTAMLF